jgi:hypothetical protein
MKHENTFRVDCAKAKWGSQEIIKQRQKGHTQFRLTMHSEKLRQKDFRKRKAKRKRKTSINEEEVHILR